MSSGAVNLGGLTPILTNFGSSTKDLLVAEYDVPQTKVKKTLFYKYGQLSIPKWALIPAGILTFGLITALCAIIVNSILSQGTSTVTYSQICSPTSKCNSSVGLICGSQSKCVCPTTKYWYEDKCVGQPTYGQQCNQTSECRTDLNLMCAEIEGQCNCPNPTIVQTCDCSSTSYWTGSTCTARSSNLGACSVSGTSYQCISNLYCDGSMCVCAPNTQYWNATASECYSVDKYQALCNLTTASSCDVSVSLLCQPAGSGSQCPFNVTANSTSCDCVNGTYWNGGSCAAKKSINVPCFWNCECNSSAGLQCLNMSCVCPQKTSWVTQSSLCEGQLNYVQSPCYNNTQCDTTQGLTCYLSGSACNCPRNSSYNMCDCLQGQYYDYNLTSCQKANFYNETCTGNYMCDSTLGLFCQTTISNATNCSCPEPIRLNMCDCNMTSYWNGITCTPRLAANSSCSDAYVCQTNLTCIANETSLGIFSDVCRCPLGSYYVNGSGCVTSQNYLGTCVGSYQCYEPAPLSCRYNDTGLTCLDTSVTSLPACDCQDDYYYNMVLQTCIPLANRNSSCTATCQCIQPYQCISNICQCPNYYSSINKTCVIYLSFGDQCSNSTVCSATPNSLMICMNGTCGCNSTAFWNGSQCQFTNSFRDICTNDYNCNNGLVCQSIPCIDSNKRCSCPNNYYYSANHSNCALCNGTQTSYTKYVINYPTSDLCVGIRTPSGGALSTFSSANTDCNSLTNMTSFGSPRLLSVHSQSEINCIATVLKNINSGACYSRLFLLGFTTPNATFYDGTSYSSVFSSPVIQPSQCLTCCYNSNNNGSLYFGACTGSAAGKEYGAICDYRVI